MLSKKERLPRTDFQSLLLEPKLQTVYNKLGTLKFIASNTPAFSVVTSSRHEKGAVGRNKLRRRVYTLFQGVFPQIRGILYISKQAYTLEMAEIIKLFNDLLAKTQKNTQ